MVLNERVFLLKVICLHLIPIRWKKTPIIDCITHLLLRNVALSDVILFGLPMSLANLVFVLSTICGTRAVEVISRVQKSKKHFKI